MTSPDFDLFAPDGRLHRFRRKTIRDHLALAAAVAAGLALWAVLLWPLVQWLTG